MANPRKRELAVDTAVQWVALVLATIATVSTTLDTAQGGVLAAIWAILITYEEWSGGIVETELGRAGWRLSALLGKLFALPKAN